MSLGALQHLQRPGWARYQGNLLCCLRSTQLAVWQSGSLAVCLVTRNARVDADLRCDRACKVPTQYRQWVINGNALSWPWTWTWTWMKSLHRLGCSYPPVVHHLRQITQDLHTAHCTRPPPSASDSDSTMHRKTLKHPDRDASPARRKLHFMLVAISTMGEPANFHAP